MAGHVIRKKDGRWSNALLKWYEGKTLGHNTTTLHWEHDMEAWLKYKLFDDYRTWQQIAINADEWAKVRTQYAEDWPSNTFTSHKNKRQQYKSRICIFTGEATDVAKVYKKEDTTRIQNRSEHLRVIPTPGKTKIIKIVLKRLKGHDDTVILNAPTPVVHLADGAL